MRLHRCECDEMRRNANERMCSVRSLLLYQMSWDATNFWVLFLDASISSTFSCFSPANIGSVTIRPKREIKAEIVWMRIASNVTTARTTNYDEVKNVHFCTFSGFYGRAEAPTAIVIKPKIGLSLSELWVVGASVDRIRRIIHAE